MNRTQRAEKPLFNLTNRAPASARALSPRTTLCAIGGVLSIQGVTFSPRCQREIITEVRGLYKPLKDALDGIMNVRLGDDGRNLIRMRSMREVGFGGKWRELMIGPNLEVSLRE